MGTNLGRAIRAGLALASVACLCGGGVAAAESGLDGVAASANAVRPVGLGETAPIATLRDVDGKPVPLDAYVGSGLVALVFYRGGW